MNEWRWIMAGTFGAVFAGAVAANWVAVFGGDGRMQWAVGSTVAFISALYCLWKGSHAY